MLHNRKICTLNELLGIICVYNCMANIYLMSLSVIIYKDIECRIKSHFAQKYTFIFDITIDFLVYCTFKICILVIVSLQV